jgi:hypothetical protein
MKVEEKLENQEKKNRGLEKTIKKLKDRIGILDRNLAKTIKAWNKDKQNWTSQSNTPKETKSGTKVDEDEKRDGAPWMAVGC